MSAGMLIGLVLASAVAAAPAPDQGNAAEKAERPAAEVDVDPKRFGTSPADRAYGAFQRGLYITALNLAKPLAEEGNASAQTLVAEIYARGLGVPRDPGKAAEWYVRAAEQGIAEAQFQYALMLIDGSHVARDEARALMLMRQAADAENSLAQFNYAQLLLDRSLGAETVKEAVSYYERAAKQGLPDAQYAMSEVYVNGVGGKPKDDTMARKWLALAARGGYDTAQVELGTWLVEGRGGDRQPKAGFHWIETAAQGGNVAAQNRLAKLYRAGIGTEGDPIAAAAWYILARRAGLVDREMNVFLDGLTAEQSKRALEQANRLR